MVLDDDTRKLRDTIGKTHLSLTTETEFNIPHLSYTQFRLLLPSFIESYRIKTLVSKVLLFLEWEDNDVCWAGLESREFIPRVFVGFLIMQYRPQELHNATAFLMSKTHACSRPARSLFCTSLCTSCTHGTPQRTRSTRTPRLFSRFLGYVSSPFSSWQWHKISKSQVFQRTQTRRCMFSILFLAFLLEILTSGLYALES